LCPQRIVLARYPRGLRPRIAERRIVDLPGQAGTWQAGLEALPAALDGMRARGSEVEVVLSNHFARYALLAWSAALGSAAEWQALARHHFAAVHGEAAAGWSLGIARTSARGPRLACATDAALLAGLDRIAASAGARLVSVQPYLVAAFNAMRRRIGPSSCWLVVAEPGRHALALIEDGAWRAVRSRAVDARWREALQGILEREAALLGLERPCASVVAHSLEEPAADLADGLALRDLTPALGTGERALAMALA
jgi:hypothetical protein